MNADKVTTTGLWLTKREQNNQVSFVSYITVTLSLIGLISLQAVNV